MRKPPRPRTKPEPNSDPNANPNASPATQAGKPAAAGAQASMLQVTRLALMAVVGRWAFLAGAVVLAFGGAMLAAAWQIGPVWYAMVLDAERMSGETEAEVRDPFFRLTADLQRLSPGVHWSAHAGLQLCFVAEYAVAEGEERAAVAHARVFCGDAHKPSPPQLIEVLDPAPPIPDLRLQWPRDADGNPRIALRLPESLQSHLRTQTAFYWPVTGKTESAHAALPPPGSEFDHLLLAFDRPLEWLLRSWPAAPPPGLALRYDPAQPERAEPAFFIESLDMSPAHWAFAAFAFGVGGFLWRLGILTAFFDLHPWAQRGLMLLPLLALPWWSEPADRLLRWAGQDAYYLARDLSADLTAEVRVPYTAHAPEAFAGEALLEWSPLGADSHYAELLSGFDLRRPDPPPADADAALALLLDRAAGQVRERSDADAAALFSRLAQQELHGRPEAGLMFVAAARELVLDPARDQAAHQAANRFLWWHSVTPRLPQPQEPAYRGRIALWQSLLDVPDPAVRNQARWALERLAP